MAIRPGTTEDVPAVARLHKGAFKDEVSFLSQSDVRLIERFYRECTTDCIFLVDENRGRVTGFVVGGKNEKVSSARRRFYWNNLGWCLRETLSNVRPAFRSLRGWKNLFLADRSAANESVNTSAILLVIAVSDELRGTGLAHRLCDAFEANLGATEEYELSVAKTNLAAVQFYHKRGLVLGAEDGDSMTLVKRISASPALEAQRRP